MTINRETVGAWVIHHGKKLVLVTSGPADFPIIDEAAKAATLLSKLGETNQANLSKTQVQAIAQASGLNPRHELSGLLQVLEKKRLIEQSDNEISVLGITTRGVLGHAADMYRDSNPSAEEEASITLAEIASQVPVRRSDVSEKIGDMHRLTNNQVQDFLNRAEEIGFVDKEDDGTDRLLFNGNLFRRDMVAKTKKVLASLNTADQEKITRIEAELARKGCLTASYVKEVLSVALFEKLVAAGIYDISQVRNEEGSHSYITSPAAFHKFVNPVIDDCFDMAKSLVAALSYGMMSRRRSQGRIVSLSLLLHKLIAGCEVGSATAIGEDYRVLEINRVVKLRPDPKYSGRYSMCLLKKEVGELALNVLTQENASVQPLADRYLLKAPMSDYTGPEESRITLRRRQSEISKRRTLDILEAVRGGRILS